MRPSHRLGGLAAVLLASTCLTPHSARATDFTINNQADLVAALNPTTGAQNGDRIVFNANVALTADLPIVQKSVTIVGNNHTLDGGNTYRGLLVYSGTVAIGDLTIQNAKAQGGTGGTGGLGGGGAGLGGALFVASGANVTVSNVTLDNNRAVGGNGGANDGSGTSSGGGGGMGGNGGNSTLYSGGGGGGLGVGADGGSTGNTGSAGIATGIASGGSGGSGANGTNPGGSGGLNGGGGGGGGQSSGGTSASIYGGGGGGGGIGGGSGGAGGSNGSGAAGGSGGFGGGGGGNGPGGGGNGGFGGGSGGGSGTGGFGGGGGANGNSGGFGGGNGSGTGGGGGAGMGGAIFVQGGGNLTLTGSLTVNGNTVSGGSGASSTTNGSAFGSGMFLQGSGTLTFSSGTGQTQTVSDGIADQTGSGGTGSNAGSWALQKGGTGTLVLSGVNTYSGATTILSGTLRGGAANAFSANSATTVSTATILDLGGYNQTIGSLAGSGTVTNSGPNTATLTAGGDNGSTTFSGVIQDGAAQTGLTKTGTGTLTLSGTNTYTAGTTVNAGTLAITNGQAPGSGAITLNGGKLLGKANLSLGNQVAVAPGSSGTIAAASGTTLTIAGPFNLQRSTAVFGSTADTGTVVLALSVATLTGDSAIVVAGGTLKDGNVLSALTSIVSSTTVDAGATLDFNGHAGTVKNLQGAGTVANGGQTLTINSGNFSGAITGSGGLVKNGPDTLVLGGTGTFSNGTRVDGGTLEVASNSALGSRTVTVDNSANQAATLKIDSGITVGNHVFLNNGGALDNAGTISYAVTGQWAVESTAGLATAINRNTGTILGGIGGVDLRAGGTITNEGGTIKATDVGSYGAVIQGTTGSVTNSNGGTITAGWVGVALYAGGTIANQGGTITGTDSDSRGAFILGATGSIANTGGGTIRGVETGVVLGAGGTVTNGAASTIQGGLAAVQVDGGSATLNNAGTIIGNVDLDRSRNDPANQVTLFSGSSIQGNLYIGANGASTLTLDGTGAQAYSQAVTGTTSFAGQLIKRGTGTWIIDTVVSAGNTTVAAGGLIVNGRLGSGITVDSGGMLGGSGIITRDVINNGVLAPGNSIGTLTVNGNYAQGTGGTYVVEANAAGQSDRLNVSGTATLGGSVQVLAAPGAYARNTTYTILSASRGINGAYAGVASNLAFLVPTLQYDADNVFLTLLMTQSAFATGGQTGNQKSVGAALDRANLSATGDFNNVLNAIAGLGTAQGPRALDAISGQPYANLGTANLQNGLAFLNAVGQQIAASRGDGGGTRVALAEACESACDAAHPSPWSAWLSAVGGFGSVAGNGNSATLSYNFGGTVAGIDYRFDPRFLAGLGLGYATGTQWTRGFEGSVNSNSYSATLYGSFHDAGFYADALLGYAYTDNRMRRTILVPGLAPRIATGGGGGNQLQGQLETGYRIGLYEPAAAAVTPFVRLQAASSSSNGFTETGADSLNLSVAQQTTTSLRTTLGAALDGTIGGAALTVRLGWTHEHADTARPMTAAFAGAPGTPFTVYGATPQRDSAAIGFSANLPVGDATRLYARYDGEIGGGSDNHALSVGLRMTW
ncbi:MAG: autotransporter domain-containing protein [Reyranella sp.]|uniref:autotransporter domain-containing protein n=1 Tax=Reyranella sp. TaxID=1929291 RepID=UPI001AD4EF4D|nr:autotransporter domain-containing protein [Reyranella sp.]MBN9090041.1 autotransporter domain-containing protein [Reyranella sp.]